MVMISSKLIYVLTQLLECVVTPVEVFASRVKEIVRKHKIGTLP